MKIVTIISFYVKLLKDGNKRQVKHYLIGGCDKVVVFYKRMPSSHNGTYLALTLTLTIVLTLLLSTAVNKAPVCKTLPTKCSDIHFRVSYTQNDGLMLGVKKFAPLSNLPQAYFISVMLRLFECKRSIGRQCG